MLFNRHGLQQKNWRMVKKGKHILFGCSLFFVVGGVNISGPQVTYAKEASEIEIAAKQIETDNIVNKKSKIENLASKDKKQVESFVDKIVDTTVLTEDGEKTTTKKEVSKRSLIELITKIKNTDISKKTEKSVTELNLALVRAEKAIENKEITQEEIDKEVKTLKEVFEKSEDKPKEYKKSEAKEKDDKIDSGKDTKVKQQENNTEDAARKHNEKITKVTKIIKEINNLASEINYEFSDDEKELVNAIEKLPTTTDNNREENIQKLLNEAIYLRNRVANRVTRSHSGKRDPRNGKVIDKNGESGFRAIWIASIANKYEGSNNLVNENRTDLTFYNSDTLFSVMTAYGKRGNGEPLVKYQYGPKRGEEDPTPYYVKRVRIISGLNQVKGLKLRVAYKNFQTGKKEEVDITEQYWNVNNPEVQMALVGTIGDGGNVTPGTYHITIGANGTHKQNTITYTLTIKPQSERNTVNNLTPTYVGDVRHLTESEKTALIEKFKVEHPNVVSRAHHIDYDHAEVSSDGATMTIHFKDGFDTKTIQTNTKNDAVAKYQQLTALYGDSHDFYKNPRNLVKSITGNELPSTVDVQWKTPFNLQQSGTRNVVVTVTYQNGTVKDVSTPYTVLDFVGKQDKHINQHQSGELGDARSYITLSNGTAPATDLTIRWKGGSSTVDTSAAGVKHKEIEILRGNHLMKTVAIPVEIVDNISPTITAPDSVLLTRLEGLPSEINISAQDNNKGVGLKDGNPITVENLLNPLFYNPRTSKIEINGVIPNNFQNGRSSIQVTVKAVDRKGNTATKNITFNIQSQTQKYTAVANPKIQEVSHAQTPDPGASIATTGLPADTQYKWERKPNTNTPGSKEGIVKVTYPDGSTDTVTVTIKVRKLSDEYTPTGSKIVRNQNVPVTFDDLKAAVTINNNGNNKVKRVTAPTVDTSVAGEKVINAMVTYIDDTNAPVTIPLEVKDITAPTIQTPSDRQNWDLIALDNTLPGMRVISVDNTGGTGIKSTIVSGLPEFLVLDKEFNDIKFKNGVQAVPKLPAGQDSKTYTVNIQVTDNSNNLSQRQVTITVKSMTTKYTATPNSQKQTVSYGEMPDAGTSINKYGLPIGTTYTWATPPSTVTDPGEKAGIVTVTYPDGSKDTVNVTVVVRKLSDEHTPSAREIQVNQHDTVTNEQLKAAVTVITKNGSIIRNDKISKVEPKFNIDTSRYGNRMIPVKITYIDGSEHDVYIPLTIRDVTPPVIQTPVERENWKMTALDKTIPLMKVIAEDNEGGSGIGTVTISNLPSFLVYDNTSRTIVFKQGIKEVDRAPKDSEKIQYGVTVKVIDNAGNPTSRTINITIYSMKGWFNPKQIPQVVNNGQVPNVESSINKTGLPEGTRISWKIPPVVNTPGMTTGQAEVEYPDGSKDVVTVNITVRKISEEYTATGTRIEVNQDEIVTPDMLKRAVNTINAQGENGVSKVSRVESKAPINTRVYGSKTIQAKVIYVDGSEQDITIGLKVKDITRPTIETPDEGKNWEITALDTVLPNMMVRSEDNTDGSGIRITTVTGLPDYLEYDSITKTIKFKIGKHKVEELPKNTSSKEFILTIQAEDNAGNISTKNAKITVFSMSAKNNPVGKPQEVDNGHVPESEASVNKTGLPEGTTVTWKTTPDVSTPGSHPGVALVHYPDGTEDEVEVPVRVKEQKETFNPTAKEPNQKVRHNEVPDPEKSINTNDLPEGTKYSWTEQPDTSKPGSKTGKVLITYPDKSTEEVTVTVEVTPQKDEYTPTAIAQEVDNGHVPEPEASVNKTGLPEGTTVTWKTTPDVSTPGSHPGVALVHYPDGTEDEVEVPVRVKEQKETFNPTAKEPNQKVRHNEVPDPEKSINTNDLPEGTKYSWTEQPDTSKPGSKTGKVLITYPDKSTEEVTVTVEVTPQKDEYTPTAIAQEVDNGHVPEPEASVNKTGLPEGTTVTWKTTPDVSTPGSHPGVALVHYPDGTEDEVEVPVRVKEQKETFNPTAKEPNQKVRHNEVPDPEKSINTNDLPEGTKYSWTEQPDTSKPGSKTGKVLITYPDKSTEEVTVTVEVTPQKDEYTPTAIAQEVDNGHVPEPEASVNKTGLPEGTTVTWKTTPDVSTPGSHPGVALVHYPDGTEDEVEVPVRVKEQKETFNPTAKEPNQKVRHNEVPDPEKSINTNDLPEGTKYSWTEQPDTSKPGSKTGKVLITYPDKSTEEVTVTVEVTPQKDEYTPTAIAQEVDNGHVPEPEASVNKTGLPEGTTVTWKTTPDVSTPGSHPGVALVHYPDGTEDEVEVPVRVKEQKETFNPTAKEPNQKVRHNEVPDPEKSINTNDLPEGTKYSWTEQPDTSKPGSKTGKVLITYPDKSTEEVTVTVEVTPQKDEYTPTAIAQEVDNGHVPEPEASVNKTGLPEGTTVTWKTTPDVSTPGSHPGVALVHYPDGTEDEVEVPVRVKEQKETFNPTAKEPNQKVRHNEVPDPEKSINTNDLPEGTKYSWTEQPDTSKPGSKTGKVLITYPDKSTEEVTVTVEVTPQKDEYTPTAIAQEVDNGHVPEPEASVNKTGLPEGTTVTWKTTPDVSTPGSHPGVALVHYPDGTEDEVEVPVRVKEQKETFNPTAKEPNQKVRHNEVPDPEKSINTNDLPEGTKYSWTEQPDTSKPGSKTGKVLITYPDKSTEEVTVTVEVTPQKDEYTPTAIAQEVDNGHVPEPEASVNKTGLPEGTTVTWKTTPDVSTPGSHPGVALVHYPDGTEDEVEVPVRVKEQKETFNPTAKEPNQKVRHNEVPDPEKSINTNDLPEGTKYSWTEQPDTSKPGSKTGKVLITYPDKSTEEVTVTVEVTPQKDEYTPTAIAQEVDNGHVPEPEASVNKTGLPEGTTVTWKTTPDVSTPGSHPGVALVHYPDGTEDEVEVPVRVKEQKETFNPTAKEPNQKVRHNEVPDPEKSINTNDLPEGTKYSWTEQPDTSKPGSKTGKVLITYPDKSTEEVTVTVEVTPQKDEYTPTAIAQEVDNGHVPEPEASVNKTGLPEGTTVTWKTTPDVSTPGSHPGVALVHYPDGTEDEVEVPVRVKEQKETFNPTAKEPNQKVRHNEVPDPEKSINTNDLPEGTKYSWTEQPDTSKPGSKTGKVLITYPDKSTEEVTVTVEVTPQKDEYTPTAIAQEVDNGHVPEPEASVNKTGLPEGTTVTWKTTPDVSTPGSHPGVALVHYPDGTEDEVEVPVRVKEQKETFNPTAKEPNQKVRHNEVPDPEKSINTNDLPEGTKYSWTEQPDTSKPGSKTGKVLITYPDKSTEEVTVTVEVTPQKDEYTPTAIAQEVDNGHVPEPEASVNKTGLPEGTTVTWKTTPDVSTPGSHPGVALVHYPDGTEDEVEVPVRVKEQKETFNPTAKEPNQKVRHNEVPDPEKSINTNDLPEGTKYSWTEQPDTSKPGSKTGKVLITYPDKSTEEVTVTVEVTPQKDEYTPTAIAQEVDNGHVPEPEASVNKTGLPEGTTVTWKTTPDVSTPGSHPGVALVHYPDGTEDEVEVPVRVKEQKETFNPTAKEPNQKVRHNEVPDPEKSINTNDLPEGTKYSWTEQPDTSKPGSKTGKVLITYPDKSTEEVTVTVEVTPQKDEYTPTAIAQEVDNGHVPEPEASVNKTGLPEGTTVTWKTTPDVSTPGSHPGVALVHYPDGTEDEVEVPVRVKEQKETFNPTAKEPNQKVRHNEVPDPEKSINTNDLPEGTKYSWTEQPDTSKPGSKTGKVLITYPDKSTEEVTVTVEVTPQKDEYTPTAIAQEVDNGHVPEPEASVNKTGLPEGTTVTWKTTPDVSTPGSHPGVALVHYPDGTEDEVEVPVRVKEQKETFNPTAKEPNQKVRHNEVPDPEKSINTNDLPEGTKYSWTEQPDTSKPGSKTGKVLITYPDKSTEEVTVTVEVTPQKDEYTPTAIAQEVDNGHVPEPEASVNKTGLPEGTTVTWKTTPDVSTPGSHPGVALVHYPDGTEDEVEVPVRVKEQKETFNPTAKEPNQKVRHNEVPDPEKSINTNDLPEGTKYSWTEQPDTSKPGSKTGKVLITYPDKSTEEVTVTVEVTPQKDEYTPTAIAQEVDNGHVPEPEASVNKTGLPEGTTVTWKTTPDVSTPGSHPGVALVHYPDGTEDEVEVPVRVKEQKETFNPTAKEPNQKVRHNEVPDPEKSINTNDLPEGTKYSWTEQPDTSKPGSKTGKVLITYPDKSTEEVTVTVEVTPQKDEYTPTAIAQEVDNGHVPEPEASVNKTGLPEGTTVTWKTTPDVSTPGSHPGVALVHYPDGTEDEVEVPVRVKEQKETFNPTAKEPNQKVRHNEVPDPEKSINTNDLPEGTKYSWTEQPDTSKPGSKTGKVLITYPDKSTEEVTVTVEVTPQKDEYTPTAIAQEVDNGHVPEPEASVNKTGLPEGTTVTWKTTPDVSTPGSHPGVALVHYPDGTEDEVEVPVRVKEQKETFNPTAKEPNQKVRHNEVPDPEKSINTNDLPEGTKYSWTEQPDTSKPGSKTGKVLITYPDKSTEEVTVTVEVTPQKDEYTPTAIAQEVDNGHVPEPEASVNKTGLPEGTTVTWKTTPDVSTPGSHPGVALVHYPDGTEDEVEVPVRVKEQKETFNPTAKEPNQKVRHNEVPDPEKSINTNDLPEGTKYSWTEQPDTSKPGSKTGKVLITYPDKSTEEVTVTVEVTPQKDEYTPTAIAQEVDNGHVPEPEASVNKTGLPEGTTVTWKTTPDVSTPGSHPGVALVHYPDGTEDEVEVPVRVKEQKETFNPTAKEPNQKVRHNEVPDPEKSINTNDLPEGTKYSWTEQPDTSKPGSKTGKVLITYPDKSTEEVTVTVEVTPQKDEYTPTAIAQEVDNGHVPEPEASVNKTGLPEGTTVTWKTTPDVSTPGSHPGVALVHYPDGTEDEVEVPVRVKEQKETFNPTAKEPNQKVRHNEVPDPEKSINTNDLPEGTKYSWTEQPDTSKPGSKTGKVLITYPDKSTEEVTVTVEVTPQKDEYTPTAIAQEVDNGHVPEPEASVNKTGLPEGTTVTWKTTPDVSTPGSHPGVALVHYPDGTEDEVEVPVRVKEQKETFNPTAKEPNQKVRHNEVPDPEKSINTNDLPEGTKYSWTEQPDTSKPGSKTGKVLITYPDKSTEEVTVTVEVTPQKDEYTPTAIAQEVDNGHVPEPEASVNKTGLPEGTTVTWKTTPDVSTPGSHPGVALVHYPDGTEDEVEVPVRVKEQKETFNPTAKEPNQKVRHNEVPDPEKSINTNDLPEGTKYSWTEQPDTSKPGSKTGKVLITYPDKSTEEVTVTVEVTPQKDEYTPTAIAQEVDNGHVPEPEASVNKTGLPEGTTVTWKTTPDVSTPGSHPGVALVHYPDGTEDEVEVPVRVKEQKETFNPTAKEPNQKVRHNEVPDPEKSINTNDLPEGTKYSWTEQPDTSKPGSKTGKVLITYPDKSTEEVTVTVEVTPQKDEYTPTAIAQEVDNGHVPEPEASVNKTGLPEGTTVTWKTTPDVSTPGSHPGVALVHYPDGTEDEVEVPVRVKEQKETFNPTAKEPNQKVRHNEVPDPEKSINTNDLPEGTKYSWTEQPDTSKPGSKTGKVLITYPDKSTEEVTVTVEVTPQKDEYTPTAIAQEVDNGHVPEPEASVNKTGLPEGTTVTWKTTPDVSTPGSHPGVALVHYPDGTEDEVEVPVRVKEQKETFNPTAKEPNQKVRHNEVPDPEKSINTNDLPEGTKYSWTEQPDTSKPGSKTGKVLITYPDKSTEEVTVTVEVTPQKDEYTPTAIAQEVDNGHVPEPEASVNKTGLPEGTTVTWKTTPDVSTPGSHPGVALVHYPDGTEDEVEVPVRVKEQKETFNPTAKEPNQKVRHNEVPDPEKSINTNDLPEGTKYSWTEQPDTSKPGSKTGKVLITYPDKSTEEVTVTVEVTPQKDEYTPTAIAQEVDNGHVPEPEASVNKTGLPEGTTVTWKTTPDVSTPGSHPGVALVHYPDGTEDEVEVPVRVKEQKETFNPTAKEPNQKVRHNEVPDPEKSINTNDLPEGTKYSWTEQPDTSKPGSKTGKVLITYPDKSTEEVTVTVEVTPQKDEYTPTAIAQEVDNGHVPEPEASVNKTGLPEGTTVTWKTTPDVSTPGSHPGVALVHYPDGTEDEVEVPVRVKEQKETFNPTAKEPNQKVRHNEVPDPEKSINTNDLPEGTKYSWTEQPDTSKPGSKTGKVLITYPDKSTEEVTVTVEVTPQKDEYTPTAIAQEVDNGHVPEPEASVNKTGLPEGTTVTWKTTPDVSTPGSHPGVALVHYPDGTEDEVEVPVRVKEQKETFNPTAKEPNQKVRHNEVPDPEKSINTNDLPEGTKYSWTEQPDTSKPGSKTGKVLITYPDKSTEEVTVTVEVTPQKDEYTPTAIAQEVDNGHVPEPEASVNKTGLPEGTTVTWKTTPDVSTPGSHPGVALVHYPDGTEDEVEVPVRVKEQKETFNPTAKEPNQKVRHNEVPDPEKSINTNDLPEGTKYSWTEQPDTSKPGSKTGKVLITYPDKSTEEVTVTVEVTPQKDEYTPTAIAQEVDNGHVPEPEASVNKTGLPEGTTVTWKTTPDVSTPGSHPGVALVHYPDGTEDEVEVPVVVRQSNEKGIPEVQPSIPEFVGGVNGEPEVQSALPEYTGGVNGKPEVQPVLPEYTGGANGEPEVQSALPEYTGGVNGDPEVQPALPEFAGGVNGEPEVQPALPEFTGGVKGDPEVQPVLPEFAGGVKGDPEVQPALPEFAGGVKGDPEVQPALPEYTGGVNGEPEVQPALPEYTGGVNGEPEVQPALPEYTGGANDESEIRSSFRDKTSNVATKRLANTGQSQNNSELAGFGLAIVGLFAAIKRRKNEEE